MADCRKQIRDLPLQLSLKTANVQEQVNLICLPFAGGSSYSYSTFGPCLFPGIKLLPVELPGRGKRSREALLYDANALAGDVFQSLRAEIASGKPYSVFGHSMGALLGYLLLRRILKEDLPLPLHFFVSGRGGPSAPNDREHYYKLPKQEFRDKLRELGGSPPEVLEHDALMDFFEPVLRADFQVVETYEHNGEAPLPVPITVLIGKQDTITLEAARMWQEESTSPVKVHEYDGGHFFLFERQKEICSMVSAVLNDALQKVYNKRAF